MLVPFPFTDLSGNKRRPALVLSPEDFHDEDLILCAITSRLPERFSRWEVSLAARDMAQEELPRESVIKVGKLFTMHRKLISSRFGAVKQEKLQEVLGGLRRLFAGDDRAARNVPATAHDEEELRTEALDEAVPGLLSMNAFEDRGVVRAWKTFDRDTMDRLYERGLISDPKSKARSVVLTKEGRRAAEEAFRELFAS